MTRGGIVTSLMRRTALANALAKQGKVVRIPPSQHRTAPAASPPVGGSKDNPHPPRGSHTGGDETDG